MTSQEYISVPQSTEEHVSAKDERDPWGFEFIASSYRKLFPTNAKAQRSRLCGVFGWTADKDTNGKKEEEDIDPNWQPWGRHFILPWFMQCELNNNPDSLPLLRPTSYLDGLRGAAALLVYCQNHQTWAHGPWPVIEYAFGYDGRFFAATFPLLRTFFSGANFAACLFFVISGYVLSLKPLGLIHSGELIGMGNNLASATFKRWMRLCIPLIVTTVAYVCIWYALDIWTPFPKKMPTFGAEVMRLQRELSSFCFVFSNQQTIPYNMTLWAVPLLMKGSIVVYTTIMGLSRVTLRFRLFALLGLVVYFTALTDGWFCALHVAGLLLCELDVRASDANLPSWMYKLETRRNWLKQAVWTLVWLLGVYLGGFPNQGEFDKSPGWIWLSKLIPPIMSSGKYFYPMIGAVLTIAASGRLGWVRWCLETRVCQYLGRIAYALFLVHNPLLWTLGDRVYLATGILREQRNEILVWKNAFPISNKGPYGLELSFLASQIVLLPITLWVAELVASLIDETGQAFALKVYVMMELGDDEIQNSTEDD